ncbi:MAG: tetrahydromethanopterin S-methyltransferase subunit H [Desulfurococcaceae archaeon]
MLYAVGKYKIGGLVGEGPTWVIATILYHGDKCLLSPKGDFDRNALSTKLQEALSITSEYKLVLGVDAVIPSVEAASQILSFLGEFNIPVFIDSPSPEVRAKSYLAAGELGLGEYAIANGLYVNSPPEELDALRESKLKKAVIIAFDPRDPYKYIQPESRIALLEERLIPLARNAGVELFFADFVVLDPGSIAICGETLRLFKSKYGEPAGCAPANALGSVSKSTVSVDELYGIHGGSAAYLRMMGADFVMIGPLGRVKYVAPVLAMVDGLLGYALRRQGIRLPEEHPIKGLLKKVQRLFAQPVLPGT